MANMTSEEAEKALIDSIQRVAEAARDAVANAERIGSRDNWQIHGEDMDAMREALAGWTKASNDLLASTTAPPRVENALWPRGRRNAKREVKP